MERTAGKRYVPRCCSGWNAVFFLVSCIEQAQSCDEEIHGPFRGISVFWSENLPYFLVHAAIQNVAHTDADVVDFLCKRMPRVESFQAHQLDYAERFTFSRFNCQYIILGRRFIPISTISNPVPPLQYFIIIRSMTIFFHIFTKFYIFLFF